MREQLTYYLKGKKAEVLYKSKYFNLVPAEEFLLTIGDESSDKASNQHWAYKMHSLYGALHQWLYNATVFCLALAYHACSSNTRMLSKEHWTSDEQSSPWKKIAEVSKVITRCKRWIKELNIFNIYLNSLRLSSGGPE
jgi:hypothetical protein